MDELSLLGVGTAVTSERTGGLAMVKGVTVSEALGLLAESVTIIVQSEYVPSAKLLKVIELLPEDAEVVELLQLPPYEIVPASFELKT